MLKVTVRTLVVALLVCLGTARTDAIESAVDNASENTIESETASRTPSGQLSRLDRAPLHQERATRAVREDRDQRHSLSNIRTSPRGAAPGPDPRLAHSDLPSGQRSRIDTSPHATDPGAPVQVMTRSAGKDLRAPSPPSAERGEPDLAPRMDVADDTRLGRASFEDWLFGR